MATSYNIERDDLMILLTTYEERKGESKQTLEQARIAYEAAEKEYKVLEDKILVLRRQLDPNPGAGADKFPSLGVWNDKIKFVLELFHRPMATSEIVTVLEKYIPEWDRKQIMTSVSATISANMGTIYKRENDKIWIK